MDVRKICVVIRRIELQGFSLHLLNGSRLDPDIGLELRALICSDGREQPHASTFQTLPGFYQLASICLGFNSLQPTAILGNARLGQAACALARFIGGFNLSRNSIAAQ